LRCVVDYEAFSSGLTGHRFRNLYARRPAGVTRSGAGRRMLASLCSPAPLAGTHASALEGEFDAE
jgi:hypothetical protein